MNAVIAEMSSSSSSAGPLPRIAGDGQKRLGQRWVISTKEEMRDAAIRVTAKAKRSVSIFTHDLEPGIYDSLDYLEVIKKLILSKAYARIRVLIANPSRTIKNGNRLIHLGRRLNSYIEFRHVAHEHAGHTEAYCIADDTAVVYRLQANRWEGIADTFEPPVARLYLGTFDEIWHASENAAELRRLNL
ncbi:MAG: hypothetical protein AAF385_03175 [Pseudomonadota bacterium]